MSFDNTLLRNKYLRKAWFAAYDGKTKDKARLTKISKAIQATSTTCSLKTLVTLINGAAKLHCDRLKRLYDDCVKLDSAIAMRNRKRKSKEDETNESDIYQMQIPKAHEHGEFSLTTVSEESELSDENRTSPTLIILGKPLAKINTSNSKRALEVPTSESYRNREYIRREQTSCVSEQFSSDSESDTCTWRNVKSRRTSIIPKTRDDKKYSLRTIENESDDSDMRTALPQKTRSKLIRQHETRLRREHTHSKLKRTRSEYENSHTMTSGVGSPNNVRAKIRKNDASTLTFLHQPSTLFRNAETQTSNDFIETRRFNNSEKI